MWTRVMRIALPLITRRGEKIETWSTAETGKYNHRCHGLAQHSAAVRSFFVLATFLQATIK